MKRIARQFPGALALMVIVAVASGCRPKEGCLGAWWCWEHPSPQGNDLNSVWVFSATNAWAVGEAGTALHWNGTWWDRVETGTTEVLTGLWGFAEDDLWAVGATVRHWDGFTWSPMEVVLDGGMPLPQLNRFSKPSVAGCSPREVFVAWGTSSLLRWDGKVWTTSALPDGSPLHAVMVRCVAGKDLWVTTDRGGAFFRWEGSQWLLHTLPEGGGFDDLWGSAGDDIWAVSTRLDGFAAHWDGATWSQLAIPGRYHAGIWGSAANDVWVGDAEGVLHFDGSQWSQVAFGEHRYVSYLGGSSPRQVWGVADSGQLAHWEGAGWRSTSTLLTWERINAMHGTAADDLWTGGGSGSVLHYDGHVWARVDLEQPELEVINVWSPGKNDLWAVAARSFEVRSLFHWEGAGWNLDEAIDTTELDLIWGTSARDVWAFGATFSHWDGQSWSVVPHPHDIGTIGAVSGSGPSDIWAIQGNTAAGGFVWGPIAVVHWDGSNWSAVDLPDGLTSLRSISARTRTDVWAVGAEIVHWDGKTWTRVPLGIDHEGAQSIYARGENDVWVVTTLANAYHWNGRTWSGESIGTTLMDPKIWGVGGSIWVFDHSNRILRQP